MKRILFISVMKGAPWGGSEEFWYRLALWMAERGYIVDCCFFDWPEGKAAYIENLREKGCTLHLLPNPGSAANYFRRLTIKSKVKKQLIHLAQQQYDLTCISQGGLLDVTYPMFNSMLPYLQRFVLIYHNYNEDQVLSVSRKRLFYKWSHASRLNMAAAEKIFPVVEKIAGFQLPNQYVLKNPVTIPVQQLPTAWPPLAENGSYTWVVMGQLDVQRKAQDLLLHTLAAEKWKQRNWQLHLYGDGPDKELLSNLICKLGLAGKVFLEGHSNNVTQVLENTHLLLQVSLLDAMPLSVTEAMSMARPCIVSDVGDMPLWIGEGEQGFVVPAPIEMHIDNILEKAWSQKESWQQLGINAFHRFHQKYPVPYEPHYEKFLTGLMLD